MLFRILLIIIICFYSTVLIAQTTKPNQQQDSTLVQAQTLLEQFESFIHPITFNPGFAQLDRILDSLNRKNKDTSVLILPKQYAALGIYTQVAEPMQLWSNNRKAPRLKHQSLIDEDIIIELFNKRGELKQVRLYGSMQVSDSVGNDLSDDMKNPQARLYYPYLFGLYQKGRIIAPRRMKMQVDALPTASSIESKLKNQLDEIIQLIPVYNQKHRSKVTLQDIMATESSQMGKAISNFKRWQIRGKILDFLRQ